MSRLTSSPFHKPSPFQFPRVPLSPPETNTEQIPPSSLSATVSVAGGIDGLPHVESDVQRSQNSESPGARFRRVSSLAYHSSGLREPRERGVQRNYRYFVVVVPPPSFVQDHGQLGHTLSLGPQHRLSQGLLMPLFPTMFGQLSAIAREFNFPSTTGLCLYLHFTENGITATPRISDESWQLIWSHIFDASSPSLKLPIVGKLEFDIDLRQARWYGSWLSSSHREQLDVPSSVVPSTAPSLSHYRMDSRVTDLDLSLDDTLEQHTILPLSQVAESSVPTTRHVPRKLSLVDRLDSLSIRSGSSRPPIRAANMSPPDQVPSSSVLSPIYQEDEPKTATLATKGDIEKKVNHWRASASLNPSALAARGQTSLEPINLPNTISLDDVMREDEEEDGVLNLEDFAWSISSLGPPDYDYDDMDSVSSWSRLPSVHIASRVEGSVCLTPSDCTSFGPSDYTLPPLSPPSERAFTPDLASRMYEDAPLTPATATSWGAPSEWPPSPMSEGRVSSVDFTYRMQLSRPSTPDTATSWGAPSEWPASPMSDGRASSVDFTYRMQLSRPHTPSTATSWGPASWPPSPATPFYVHTPDAAHRSFDLDLERREGAPWNHVWPYTERRSTSSQGAPWEFVWPYTQNRVSVTTQTAPWEFVWPYTQQPSSMNSASPPWSHVWPYHKADATRRSSGRDEISVSLPCSYPSLVIYRDVYPFNLKQLYPAVQPSQLPQRSSRGYPQSLDDIYPPVIDGLSKSKLTSLQLQTPWVYPQSLSEIYPAIRTRRVIASKSLPVSVYVPCSYPSLQIYRPVYPWFSLYPAIPPRKPTQVHYPFFDLYPAVSAVRESHIRHAVPSKPVTNLLPYPVINLYPAVYPYLEVYPAVNKCTVRSPSRQHIRSRGYPDFDIYPAVKSRGYPDFDIYPARQRKDVSRRSIDLKLGTRYPYFNLYPAVYPHLVLYPSGDIKIARKQTVLSSDLKSTGYPDFDIYPAVKSRGYPDFDIYPAQRRKDVSRRSIDLKLGTKYPYFNLYPAVYPHLVLYPPGDIKIAHKQTVLSNGPKSAGYPDFDIYPALKSTGYPDFCLYPPISNVYRQKTASIVGLKTRSVGYGYPDFCIYPPVSGKNESRKLRNASTLRSSGYPNFVIYPPIMSAGYPDFCIYPPVSRRSSKPRKLRMKKTLRSSGYPDFVIYPPIMFAGYPDFCIYPPVSRRSSKPRELRMERTLRSSGYPDFIIYSPITFAGYPDFCIYPPVSVKKSVQKLGTPKMSRTGGYPDFVLYAPVYPHFCLYPSIAGGNYKQSKGVMKTQCIYGFFDLYPATYPNLVLYPPKSGELCNSQTGAKGTSKPVVVLQPVTSYPIFDLYPAVEYPFSLDRIYGGAGLSFPATKAMSQQRVATSQWPVFQIYPVVQYPFSLDHIYEAVRLPSSKLQHATKPSDPWNHVWPYQKTSALKVAVRRTPRFTHAQLHAMVFASQPPMIRHHKSHRALHDEVFNDREVDTPSGNVSLFKLPSIQVDVVPRPRPRSSSIARRPPSTAPPMRGLPPRPDSFRNSPSPSPSPPYERTRLSPTTSPVSTAPAVPVAERRKSALPPRPDSFLLMKDAEPTEPLSIPRVVSTAPGEQRTSLLHRSATSVTPSRSGELRTAALQRSASSASRLTSVGPTAELRTTTLQRSMSSASRSTTPTRRGPTNLSPVDERPPELSRSTYLNDSRSSSNVADRFSGPDTPPRPLPRKRDSLVLQRARAFENNDDEPILSKFPLPPRPSGPGLPSRISSLQSNNRIGR